MLLTDKRIFIVEDNSDNIWVLLSILKASGATVIVDWWAAGNVQQIKKAFPLDLVILDLMLPGGRSGFTVFDELRTLPDLATVPVVAVSAMDVSLALPQTREKGFSGFISKPVDRDLFPKQIAALIKGEQVWYSG